MARLGKGRERERAKRRAESSEERASRLTLQHQRLSNDSPEERAARLDNICNGWRGNPV
jgi:hypothetical protein